ncbi:MAG TPA: DUF2442 domain-containing protein [Chloroflexia bacterium]|nr:DUF2442 domain-containing protein [Chloroflexia bacterium]
MAISSSTARIDTEYVDEIGAVAIRFDRDTMFVTLRDGREIAVPVSRFPRLVHATPEQRQAFELGPDGIDIHWEEIDEDILVSNLLKDPGELLKYDEEQP